MGYDTPGVGHYNPVVGSITDKIVSEQVRTQRSVIRNLDDEVQMVQSESKGNLQTSYSREQLNDWINSPN